MRRAALSLLVSLVVASPSTALAGPRLATILLTPSVGPPAAHVAVGGSGFGPTETIDVSFDVRLVGTATTDAGGVFRVFVAVPESARPGTHVVTATGESSGLTASADFVVRTDWPDYRFDDANTGFNPFENAISPSNATSLHPAWTASGAGFFIETSPVVTGGSLFISDGWNLFAFDAGTGTLQWQVQDGYVNTTPATWNRMVFLGNWNLQMQAFDATSGHLIWTSSVGGPVESSPTVSKGLVYFGANDSSVYALNAATGQLVWKVPTGSVVTASPSVRDGVVYVGSFDHKLYALDALTGTQIWATTLDDYLDSTSPISGGSVFACTRAGTLYAVSTSSGGVEWSGPGMCSTTNETLKESPAAAYGMVFVAGDNGVMNALSASTGALVWSNPLLGEPIDSAPSVANGLVYVGSNDGHLFIMSAEDGTLIATRTTGGPGITSSPAVVNGMVYVGAWDAKVHALGL